MWKDICWADGNYFVSDNGQIKSNNRYAPDGRKLKGKILKPYKINSGYLVVDLMLQGKKKHYLVHRLVAEAFCNNYSKDLDVDHVNCNKTDNRASNLEMVSRRENLKRAKDNGLIKITEAKKEVWEKIANISREINSKKIYMYSIDNIFEEAFISLADVQRKYGYNPSAIRRAANGEQITSYNHKWRWYKSETCNDYSGQEVVLQ